MGSDPSPADAVATTPSALCFDCGYDLRQQTSDGRCPECGLPASASAEKLHQFATTGDPRAIGRVGWTVAAGFGTIMVLYIVFMVLIQFAFQVTATSQPPSWVFEFLLVLLLLVPVGALALVAWGSGRLLRSGTMRWWRRWLISLGGWIATATGAVLLLLVVVQAYRQYMFEPDLDAYQDGAPIPWGPEPIVWLEIVAAVFAWTFSITGLLFVLLLSYEIGTRIQKLWPTTRWLSRPWRTVATLLTLGGIVVAISALSTVLLPGFDRRPPVWFQVMSIGSGVMLWIGVLIFGIAGLLTAIRAPSVRRRLAEMQAIPACS